MKVGLTRSSLALAAGFAMALALGACGSSSKASNAKTGTTGSGTGAATGAAIKVGMICSCTGPFGSNVADGGDVAKAWVNTVNASGGINGHPVTLTVKDDGGTPGTSTTDVQELISSGVDVILDLSPVDAVWANYPEAAHIPVVGGNIGADPYYTNPDFYASGQTNDSIAYSVAATAKAAGATTIGQVYCAEAVQCSQSVSLIKADSQKLGVPDIYNASISATAPNFTAQCVAAQQAHVQALFIGDSPAIIARVGEDCSAQGYYPIYVTEGGGMGPQVLAAPGLSKNLWQPLSIQPYYSSAPEVQAMRSALAKYYPSDYNNSGWSEFAPGAWTGGLLIEDAVKAGGLTSGGTPSAAEITNGLNSLKADTLDGWSPPLTFTAGKPHPVDCWFTGHVSNGKETLTNNGRTTCQSSS